MRRTTILRIRKILKALLLVSLLRSPVFFDRMEHEKQIESMGSYPNPALSHTSVGSGPSNTLTSLSTAADTSSQNANNVKSSNEISNYYWGIDNRDSEFVLPGTAGTLTANSIMDSANITRISDCNTTFGSSAGNVDSSDSLKLELQLKETQIESLESEIQKLKATFNQGVKYKQNKIQMEQIPNEIDSVVEIPANLEMIFLRLSSSLRKKEEELEETKQRLESIITAIALNPSNSVTKFGRYDEEALAHKTIVRLEMLTNENREMAKMLGYGRSKEVQIELDLLKRKIQS